MKPALKYPLIGAAGLVLTLPLIHVVAVCVALNAHGKHDAIIFGGKRVQTGISEYVMKHGKHSQRLKDLVPEFLETIPSMPEGSKFDYRPSADGTKWTLDLYRTNRGILLIYRRTSAPLSTEDAKRVIQTEDGCYVLKAD